MQSRESARRLEKIPLSYPTDPATKPAMNIDRESFSSWPRIVVNLLRVRWQWLQWQWLRGCVCDRPS